MLVLLDLAHIKASKFFFSDAQKHIYGEIRILFLLI